MYSLYRQCVSEGGGVNCAVDHILQEFYTLFLTRFRTYQIASPPQTKWPVKTTLRDWCLWSSFVHDSRRDSQPRHKVLTGNENIFSRFASLSRLVLFLQKLHVNNREEVRVRVLRVLTWKEKMMFLSLLMLQYSSELSQRCTAIAEGGRPADKFSKSQKAILQA